jgi:hypothetical protein
MKRMLLLEESKDMVIIGVAYFMIPNFAIDFVEGQTLILKISGEILRKKNRR